MSEGAERERQKEELKKLVKKYRELFDKKRPYGLKKISEADVRQKFIDPLFKILGWDTENLDDYNLEMYVRPGFADITLMIDGQPVAFVEAKRFQIIPWVDRKTIDWIEEERQVMNYAASINPPVKWAILTNFERLRVFNALNGNLIMAFEDVGEYEKRFDELLYLSKESFESGRIDALEKHEEKPDIDLRFLDMLNKWRLELAKDIYDRNSNNPALMENGEISLSLVKEAIQRLIDRLIIIRYAEDRFILENPDILKGIMRPWETAKDYMELMVLVRHYFRGFDKIHDSSIFEEGHVLDSTEVGSEVLASVINDLYTVNFRKFDFDILGNTYETYLGNTLALDDKGEIVLKPVQETRKKSGIYYTPPYVVDYIVKNTLGEALKGKSVEEVKNLRLLDPSCGSGSFLIKAYDYFVNFYEEENERIDGRTREILERIKTRGNGNGLADYEALENIRKYSAYETEILKNNIYGVDLDGHAAEIAAVNLMLKALKSGEKLPLILGDHIKVGNSLISGDEDTLKRYFGDNWKEKRPFNWEEEFPEVFEGDNPGFDVIIGNPPYIRVQNLPEEDRKFFADNYRSALGSYDIYVLFVEKAIELLRDGGKFSFIMPLKFFQAEYGKKLRRLITEKCNIDLIVDFGTTKVFGDATTYPCLLFLTKAKKRKKNLKYIRIKKSAPDLKEIAKKGMKSALNDRFEIYDVSQDLLTDETWSFLRKEKEGIFKKIRDIKRNLGNIAPRIFQGLVTGADPVYFVKIVKEESPDCMRIINNIGEEYIIEKAILRPLLKGENIRRWHTRWDGYFIIYPYEVKEGHAELYSPETLEKRFPKTWEYFNHNEERLRNRENGTWKERSDWYAYGRRQNIEMFEQMKLMTGVLAKRASFTFDREGKYYFVGGGNAGGYGVVLNEKFGNSPEKYLFVLALLNSKLLDFYVHSISTKFQNDYYSYARRFIERLPIADATPSQQKDLSALADRMLSLNKELAAIDTNFENYVNRHGRVKDERLKNYLDTSRIRTLKDGKGTPANTIEHDKKNLKVRAVLVEERSDSLIFSAKIEEGEKIRLINIFSVPVEDEALRKFIYHSVRTFVKASAVGKGNLYEKILALKIPRFKESSEKNLEVIREIMALYLPALAEWNRIKGEIDETDREIDSRVYALYGLTDDEIKIIEESFGDD